MKEHNLDYQNLYCPEPLSVYTKKICDTTSQKIMTILSTDPAFHEEIKVLWPQKEQFNKL